MTSSPSSLPSSAIFSQWLRIIKVYSLNISSLEESASESYVNLFINNQQEFGSCVQWGVFVDNTLPLRSLRYRPNSIRLSVLSGSGLANLNIFNAVDVSARFLRQAERRVECRQSEVVENLLGSLIKGGKISPEPVRCGYDLWRVRRCGGQSSSPELCVNCSSSCSTSSFLTMTCSNPTESSPFGDLSTMVVGFVDLYAAPRITNLNPKPNRENITVTATLTGSGSFVCGAFENSKSPSTTEELFLGRTPVSGKTLTSSSVLTLTYTMTGLVPASPYTLYCATLSLTSTPMSQTQMLATKTTVRTQCCRKLEIRLNSQRFSDNLVTPSALTINLGPGKLSDSLQISISVITSGETLTTSRTIFNPSMLTLSSTSLKQSFDLTYRPVSAATYRLNVTLSGGSSGNYILSFPSGAEFVVQTLESPVAGPLMESASFSSDGSKIIIKFSDSTNEGGVYNPKNCSRLFQILKPLSGTYVPALWALRDCYCVWMTTSQMQISLVTRVNVGDVFKLKEGVIKAKCTSVADTNCQTWPSSPSHQITVTAPATLITPIVTILIPSDVGACDDVVLDLSSSSGSGGRDWMSMVIRVSMFSTVTNSSSILQDYLSTLVASQSSLISFLATPITISHHLLSPDSVYTLEVTLCNFLFACGIKSKTFVVSSSSNVPVVSLRAQNTITINRNTTLLISGGAYVSVCQNDAQTTSTMKTSLSLKYTWTLSKDNVLQEAPSLQSVSVNPMQFKLPAYTLSPLTLYSVQLTVMHTVSLKSSSATVLVSVNGGEIICSITSPSSSSSSTQSRLVGSDLRLRVGESLQLDWAGSYDENLVGSSTHSQLLFEWNCFKISPSYQSSCEGLLVIGASPTSSSQIQIDTNSSTVRDQDLFQFSLRGRSATAAVGDTRYCERIFNLMVLASESPLLAINVIGGSVLSSEAIKFNPSTKLKVLGSVAIKSPGQALWSVDDPSIDLLSLSLSPLSLTLGPSQTPHVFSLVVPGGSLSQSAFTLTLSCSLDNGRSSSLRVLIQPNSPPSSCSFVVDPPVGIMLQTSFLMVTSACIDEDLPFSYQFGYFYPSSIDFSPLSKDIVVLRSKMELSHASALLPSGAPEDRYALVSFVRVFDNLDSSSLSSVKVQVNQTDILPLEFLDLVSRGVNESTMSQSVDGLKAIISSSTSLLNEVNCSNAPLSVCERLNRNRCGTTVGTCGECWSGYVGISGPSNTLCMPISTRRLFVTSQTNLASQENKSCQSEADCTDGLFLECRSKRCQAIQQSCPNSCSGHGRCVFVSKYDPNVTLSECGVLDLNCVSRCDCLEGFVGSSCSRLQSELSHGQVIRRFLLGGVSKMIEMENPDRENIISWVGSLSALATEYTDLDDDSKFVLGVLCDKVLTIALELELSPEEVSGMAKAIDLILSISSNATSAGRDRQSLVSSLLQSYNKFLLGDMVEGQETVEVVTTLFRSSSFYLSSSSSSSSSHKLSSPLSFLESLAMSLPNSTSSSSNSSRMQLQSITLPALVSYPLKVSLFETYPITLISSDSSPNASELSNGFGGLLYGSPCLETNDSCVLRVELGNHNPPNVPNGDSVSFEADCSVGLIEDHFFLCPSGEQLLIHCNGSLAGKGKRRCPILTPTASCNSFTVPVDKDSGEPVFMLHCDLVSYTPTSTICDCVVVNPNNYSSRRRLQEAQSTDNGVQFSVQSIAKSVLTEFVSTWESASTLSGSDVKKSVVVLMTIGTIGLLFLSTMLLTTFIDDCDRRERRKSLALNRTETTISKGTPVRLNRMARFQDHRTKHSKSRSLIEESLPAIFKSDSLWNKFKAEVKVYHRWLGIVFYFSPEFPRSMRVLSLFSSIVIMLFIQSVTYNIADPDDGSCEACGDESCCLSLKSTLNAKEDRCQWSSDTPLIANWTLPSSGDCQFREIGGDLTRVFIVAFLSAVISAPFAMAFQYVIKHLLSRELLNEQAAPGHSIARVRSTGVQGANQNHLSELCGDSLSADFKNLMDELKGCYEQLALPEQSSSAPDFPLDDLISAWGIIDPSPVDVPQAPSLLSFGAMRGASSTAQENLLNELSSVRKEVFQEYQWFKEGAKRVYLDKTACAIAKQRRLLYLFVKDLSSGVSGQVLGNKDQRDRVVLEKVSWNWKAFGWLFVLLLNAGMLFYVYLFAVSQTHSRQAAWFQSFLVWFFFDLFVASTGAVLVTHLLIPLYVLSDIRTIKRKVLADIVSFRDKQRRRLKHLPGSRPSPGAGPHQRATFNSAKFLFTSWRIASLCPDIEESSVILEFHTPWPKKNFKRAQKTVSSTYDKRFSFLTQALSRILIFFFSSFLHVPLAVQDSVIHMATNSGFGYGVLLLLDLYRIQPLLALVPIVTLVILIHFSLSAFGARSRHEMVEALANITPMLGEEGEEKEDEEKGEGAVKSDPLGRGIFVKGEGEEGGMEVCESGPLVHEVSAKGEEAVAAASLGSRAGSDVEASDDSSFGPLVWESGSEGEEEEAEREEGRLVWDSDSSEEPWR
jgi:hypothetical protein